AKGLEIVCVNLDNTPQDAMAFLQRTPTPGTHVHGGSGLEGELASNYGVMVLPHLFLIGRDGKVVSHTLQTNSLEDEIKKLMDK
ncbi:MAG TPA: thioredoxin-like domain-containing protein, partial [Gemmataceae bacterium]|nr:thioredoxin-like domain-containing protein [Gemmataceae bacterium]